MYVLKRTKDEVELPSTDEFDNDAINFNWKYSMRRLPLSDTLFQFTIFQQHQSDVLIHEFLTKNVSGKINYNSDQFLIRTSFGYEFMYNYIRLMLLEYCEIKLCI